MQSAACGPAMDAFHRVKRDPVVLGILGLVVLLLLAVAFTFVGLAGMSGSATAIFGGVFACFGVALFVLFFRAVWIMTGGGLVHVLSIDRETLEWGYRGKEKSVAMEQVSSIHWDDSDGFTFLLDLKDGRRIRMLAIETLVPPRSRAAFLRFLRNTFPHLEIFGSINPQTDQAARADVLA